MEMSNGSHCSLSVIIVSYRNPVVLRDCLESIEEFNDIGDALEVIVVDQSEDASVLPEMTFEFANVTFLRNENRGFGSGNNVGARYAHGNVLLFLNPDTILLEPIFAFALQRFEDDPRLGLFGCRLVSGDGDRNQSFFMKRPYGFFSIMLWHIYDRFDRFNPDTMYITGADMFVSRNAFERVGGFDERMFMYYEETYLCARLMEQNYDIAYFPQKRIVHLEGKSSSNINTFLRSLDSLEILCSDLSWDYDKTLREMRKDRILMGLLPSKRKSCRKEI